MMRKLTKLRVALSFIGILALIWSVAGSHLVKRMKGVGGIFVMKMK